MSSENRSRNFPDAMEAGRHQQFCAEMADGLHALAQPLSVLRSAVELLAYGQGAAVNTQRYLDLSVENMRRTCAWFGRLQDLLLTEMQEPARAPLNLRDIVVSAIEERAADLDLRGIAISTSMPAGLGTVLGDAGRTEQAILAVLDVAVSFAERGDEVGIALASSGDFLEFSLWNSRSHGRPVHAASRLQLALARASVLSQHGRCSLTADPLCVSFAFPLGGDGHSHRAA